jgi:hypothetical protein
MSSPLPDFGLDRGTALLRKAHFTTIDATPQLHIKLEGTIIACATV